MTRYLDLSDHLVRKVPLVMAPFRSIPPTEIGERTLIASPSLSPARDETGSHFDAHGRALFNIATPGYAYEAGKINPITTRFYEQFLWGKNSCAKAEFSVFTFLASSTRWARLAVITDVHGKPLLDEHGQGQVAILEYGNHTAQRSISEIAAAINLHPDVVRKALTIWEDRKIIKRLGTRKPSDNTKGGIKAGRPTDYRRYEIHPDYVWNGPIWAGVTLAVKYAFEGWDTAASD